MKTQNKYQLGFLLVLLWLASFSLPCLAEQVVVPLPSDEAKLHSLINYAAYFWNFFYTVVVLIAFCATGLAAKLRDLVEAKVKRTWVQCVLFLLAFTLLFDIACLPESLVMSYAVPHYFKLSDQSFLSWLGDYVIGELLSLDSYVEAYGMFFFLVRRFKRSWPIILCAEAAVYYLQQGQSIIAPTGPGSGWVRLIRKNGSFFGIGEILSGGWLAPRRLVQT